MILVARYMEALRLELCAALQNSAVDPHVKHQVLKQLTKEAALKHMRLYQAEWKDKKQALDNAVMAAIIKYSGL